MAEENEQGSVQSNAPAKKGGKGKALILVVVGVLLVALGAAGFHFWQKRAAGNVKQHEAVKKNDHKSEKAGESADESADESAVKQVVELQPFIVNLADREEPRYLRMTVSLGLEEAEEKPDPLFTTKVRNAILGIVTQKTADEILTVEGKAALRKEMLSAARAAVGEPEVQAIYITDFIVQM